MIPTAVSRRASLAAALAGLIVLLPVCSLAAIAQGDAGQPVEPGAGDLVTISAQDASLSELIRMLSRAADVKIVLGDNIEKTVTVNLPNVDVETALQVIVQAAGAYWNRTPDGIYVVTATPPVAPPAPPEPKVIEPVVVAGGGAAAPLVPPALLVDPEPGNAPFPEPPEAEGSRPPRPGPPRAQDYQVALLKLNYMDCVQAALMFGGTIAGNTGAIYPNRPGRHGATPAWQYGGGASRSSAQPGNWFGGLDLSGSRGQSFRESYGGGQWEQLGGLGGGLGGGGLGGGLGGLGGGLGGGGLGGGLGGRGGGGGGLGGGGGFTALLPEEITAITAFLDDNALIVRGTPEAIDEFREIVALLDKPVKQVEISVKFVSITTTFEEAFGIDWAIKNTQIEVFNQGFAPPEAINSVVRFATGNLDATLSALEKSSRATVIHEPRVSVQNNAYASVEFTTEIPYFAAEITYNQFGQREVDFTADFISVENYLDVMPRINADDSVSLFLTPQISNVAGEVEGPNGERIPITTYQTVFTMLRVQDGDTVVIGGLVSKDDASSKLHTPLLSKIPIIGKLFDSRSKRLNDTELLIFVTPRILHDVPTD